MIYRPQFAFPTPEGFRDQEFEHYYDYTTLPALAGVGPAKLYDIPLTIDPDAEFRWRGVKFDHTTLANYGVRFRDTHLNYLSDDFVPSYLAFIGPSTDARSGGQGVDAEPELICPASGEVTLDICSYDTTPWQSGGPGNVTLCGVKRYDLLTCGCDGQ
jgi:hypothetical protein